MKKSKLEKHNARVAKRNHKLASKDAYRRACIRDGLSTPAESAVDTTKAVGGMILKGIVSTFHGAGTALQATTNAVAIVGGGTASVLRGETMVQLVEKAKKAEQAELLKIG